MNPLDFKADRLDELEPWQIEILTLQTLVVQLRAESALHTFLLERLLSKELNGQPLTVAYKDALADATKRSLAAVADSYPNRASMISVLLDALKKEEP